MKGSIIRRWLPSVAVLWYFTSLLIGVGINPVIGVVMAQFMGAFLIGYIIYWLITRKRKC